MGEILLAKYGELALKGLNKSSFEAQLLKTIRRRVAPFGNYKVYKAQSTIYVEPLDASCNMDAATTALTRVFGLAAIHRARATEKDFDAICATAKEFLAPQLRDASTFKVAAKRADKSFPMDSMELSREVGHALLEAFPHLSVRMDDPDVTVVCEIRDFCAYVHSGKIEAAGGMPTATSGRAVLMLSGGIDSPVAGYMMAKRGLDLCGVHFLSPPYTGDRARDKVERLAVQLARYTGHFALLCVPFTDVQLAIRDGAPEPYFTVLMRRSMARIANMLCARENCHALVTGESLAQVASQTLAAIHCTDNAVPIPILRPLIGMDKLEIIALARKIETFDISIEPYEDCCTLFTPRHPKTQPKMDEVIAAEAAMPALAALEEAAAANVRVKMAHFTDSL